MRIFKEKMSAQHIWRIAKYFVVAVVVVFFSFPIVWSVLSSLKSNIVILKFPPSWWFRPTSEHYVSIFVKRRLGKSFGNSFIIASVSTICSLAVGLPAAYAFSRFKIRGAGVLAFCFLTSRMAPPIATVLPLFLIFKALHLLDTRIALIIAYMSFNFSFVIWMMRGFFDEIPADLDESAMIEGCSRFRAFWKIVLPLTTPGIAASAILCFIFSWNEFLFALILTGFNAKTLPVAAAGLITDRMVLWGELCATSVVIYLPIMIFAVLLREYLVRGLTLGAIK